MDERGKLSSCGIPPVTVQAVLFVAVEGASQYISAAFNESRGPDLDNPLPELKPQHPQEPAKQSTHAQQALRIAALQWPR